MNKPSQIAQAIEIGKILKFKKSRCPLGFLKLASKLRIPTQSDLLGRSQRNFEHSELPAPVKTPVVSAYIDAKRLN
jgi:hypothetical protein